MRMNQGYVGSCLIVDEEFNVDVTKFFYLLKDSDEPLRCINHSKLLVVAQVFTIKSDHELSEVGCDIIVKWAKAFYFKGID